MDIPESLQELIVKDPSVKLFIENVINKVEQLEKRVQYLEARLAAYENPHTPPSKKRFPSQRPKSNGKPGQKKGHEGTTRPLPDPDRTIVLTACRCPNCRSRNLSIKGEQKSIIEDLPDIRHAVVTEFVQRLYVCEDCGAVIIPTHPELPKGGRFGKRLISQVTMMKYADRITYRKIRKALSRQYGIDLSAATVLDMARRASDAMRPEYDSILKRMRKKDVVNVDETSIKVNGVNHWIWVFVAGHDILIVIAESRGKCVIEQTLGKDFGGIIGCDGWKSYPSFTKLLQRCWSHLLREADDLAEKHQESRRIADELHSMLKECMDMLGTDPPPDVREQLKEAMKARMKRILCMEFESEKVKKFIGKIENGFDYWFTFVTNPKVEPTNNIAERALRESVVHRKIIGTLRNGKGTYIHETAMSVISTWENMGLNPYDQLVGVL